MAFITLSNGMQTEVDDCKFEELSKFKWSIKVVNCAHITKYYARRGFSKDGKQVTMKMHRQILGVTDPKIEVDHIDGNSLNNLSSNLRLCTRSQNLMNTRKRGGTTSRFKGVSWIKNRMEWQAAARLNSKRLFIGYYKNETEAALAYNVTASFAFGEFANLNKL